MGGITRAHRWVSSRLNRGKVLSIQKDVENKDVDDCPPAWRFTTRMKILLFPDYTHGIDEECGYSDVRIAKNVKIGDFVKLRIMDEYCAEWQAVTEEELREVEDFEEHVWGTEAMKEYAKLQFLTKTIKSFSSDGENLSFKNCLEFDEKVNPDSTADAHSELVEDFFAELEVSESCTVSQMVSMYEDLSENPDFKAEIDRQLSLLGYENPADHAVTSFADSLVVVA